MKNKRNKGCKKIEINRSKSKIPEEPKEPQKKSGIRFNNPDFQLFADAFMKSKKS